MHYRELLKALHYHEGVLFYNDYGAFTAEWPWKKSFTEDEWARVRTYAQPTLKVVYQRDLQQPGQGNTGSGLRSSRDSSPQPRRSDYGNHQDTQPGSTLQQYGESESRVLIDLEQMASKSAVFSRPS